MYMISFMKSFRSLFEKSWLLLLFFQLAASAVGQNRIRVACVGNSVTFGYGLGDPAHESYPSQLQLLLGNAYEVANFGHSGATLLRSGHKPYHKTAEYKRLLNYQPDIVIIHLGLNDTDPRNWPNYRNSFASDYATLIDGIRAVNRQMKIYICRLTPIFSGHPRFLSGTRDWYGQIQKLIPQIAENNHVELIDLNSPLQFRIDLFDDYLHPNQQGAYIIAAQIARVLAPVQHGLQVAETLGSNMVLQRNWENKIYGKATPHIKVKVMFNKIRYIVFADRDGSWQVKLPKMEAGGPYRISISACKDKIVLNNVLFGDVYLASGQSNMAFQLRHAMGGEELIKGADHLKNLRLFKCRNLMETNATVWDTIALQKVNDLTYFTGSWSSVTEDQAAHFSAVAYAFAEQITKEEQIPIGIIDLSVGGSNTESWIDRKSLENDDLLATYIHQWRTSDFIQDFCRKRASQNLALSKVKNQRHPYQPAYNFEAGVSKWLETGLRAVLWYQGESNAHHIELHEHLFKTLVSSWRKMFHQTLPFYFVQLPGLNRPSWGDFRNSQRRLEKQIERVHMAVALDLGDSLDVHPREKITIGHRLANLVKKYEYGQSVNADHPQVVKQLHADCCLYLIFNNCKELKTKNGYPLAGFQAIDEKGRIHSINAYIVAANKIAIEKPGFSIKKIVYAYEPFNRANLQNEIGTPVSTFDIIVE